MGAVSPAGTDRFPLLDQLEPGTVQRHVVTLPGSALADGQWHVTTITGKQPGPTVFINAGVHGGEYPAIETVIQLSNQLDPNELTGTVVLLPVLNTPAFWQRSMFVCPVDNLNPNRMFPGDPEGSYTEQLVHALTTQFIDHADAYIDLHGGDMVEDLVPFSICRSGDSEVDQRARTLATVFGLPYLLLVDRPVQVAKGSMSFVAAAERGVPGFIAEAGGVGRLQPEAVELLKDGVLRVLAHLGMVSPSVASAPAPTVLHSFEWLYAANAGMFYAAVAAGDDVTKGQVIGTVGSLFGEPLEEVVSPVDGTVLFLTTSPAVKADGLLIGIGVED